MYKRQELDDKQLLVELECERTLTGWVPRRLGGGFGGRKEAGQLRFGGLDRPFRKPIIVQPPNRTELPPADFSSGKEKVHTAVDDFKKQLSEEKHNKYGRPHSSQSTSTDNDSRNRQRSKRRQSDDEHYRSRSRRHNSSDEETTRNEEEKKKRKRH